MHILKFAPVLLLASHAAANITFTTIQREVHVSASGTTLMVPLTPINLIQTSTSGGVFNQTFTANPSSGLPIATANQNTTIGALGISGTVNARSAPPPFGNSNTFVTFFASATLSCEFDVDVPTPVEFTASVNTAASIFVPVTPLVSLTRQGGGFSSVAGGVPSFPNNPNPPLTAAFTGVLLPGHYFLSAVAIPGSVSYSNASGVVSGRFADLQTTFSFRVIPTPTSDTCFTPVRIGDGVPMTFSTAGATTDGPTEANLGFCCGDLQVNQDVWFAYTATCTGTATVSLCGSEFDTKVAVYDGLHCPSGPNSAIAGNDDSCGVQSSTSFPTTAGHEYLIRVGGYLAGEGIVRMSVGCQSSPPCPQDFNHDGNVDPDDLGDFITAFFGPGC